MGAEFPRLLDHVPVFRGVRVGVQARRLLVADLGQLEGEENSVAAALGAGLAHASKEPSGGGVVGVLAVQEIRVDVRLGGELLVVLELAHHGGELFRRERNNLALVAFLECLRSFERVGEGGLDGRVGRGFEEVGQIPTNGFGAGGLGRL